MELHNTGEFLPMLIPPKKFATSTLLDDLCTVRTLATETSGKVEISFFSTDTAVGSSNLMEFTTGYG